MSYFLDVILPIPLEKLFTYRISAADSSLVEIGMRVAVPFGKSKIYTGLVYSKHQKPPVAYEAKEIHQILDEEPTVNKYQLEHWEWLATYYMCTLGEVYRSALPSSLLLESETHILRNQNTPVEESDLKDDEFLVMEALRFQSTLKVNEIGDILDRKTVLPVLNRLIKQNLITLKEALYEKYKPKMVAYVRLNPNHSDDKNLESLLESLSRAPKQSDVILSFFQLQAKTKKPIEKSELQKASAASVATIKSLINKEILQEFKIREDRVSLSDDDYETKLIELNTHQEKALESIKKAFETKSVVLLHGVTSSGKTEVYTKLIEQTIASGKQVLYLLPEIALTTQLIGRLQGHFSDNISVYHSKYSLHERVEVWNNVRFNKLKATIVMGARSALFLPFSNLGLVIIDEEHEPSYKQFDPAPRYHARDAAIVLAQLHGGNTILGSATPSIESFHNAQKGKYGFAVIERRFKDVLMPAIDLVDLKEASRKRQMKGHFSNRMLEEITATLEEGEQVLLFQNRRGYAPIVECTTCGHSPQCPNCDVSLTYHIYKKQLRCHYCGYHMALQESCMACGMVTLDTKGFGTEQVEKEIQNLFPEAKVARMDLDTTRGKYAYQKIITAFEQKEIDILVGTQMITKGLDFRHVNLVGVMNADSLLNFPDFRAHERTFQLLTQVAGRSGRTQKRGHVIIQTYNPHHRILQQVTNNEYLPMFKEQLYEREQYKYPPANRILKITLKHKEFNRLNEAAKWFANSLRNVLGVTVLGPEYPPVARIRNQYLKNIIVKIPLKDSAAKTKNSIKRVATTFNAISQFKSVRIVYNVDYI